MGLVPVALEWQTLPQTAAPLVTSGASHPPAAPDPPDLPFPLAQEGQTALADLHLIVDLLDPTDLHTNSWAPALLGDPTDLAPMDRVLALLTGRWAPTDQCTGHPHTSWTVGQCPSFRWHPHISQESKSCNENLLQPDYKIFEMNKRLQQRTDDSDNLWFASLFLIVIIIVLNISMIEMMIRWDAFANEFFEDEAQLTLTFCLEDGPKRYSEHRHHKHTEYLSRISNSSKDDNIDDQDDEMMITPLLQLLVEHSFLASSGVYLRYLSTISPFKKSVL